MDSFLVVAVFMSASCLLTHSVHAGATEKESFKAVLDFCLDLPADTDLARQHLQIRGFDEIEDDKATLRLGLAAALASRFDLDDLEDSFRNAAFMSASFLGNSALGKDQPTFRNGQLELATIGLNEGTPSCIIAGPSEAMVHDLGGARTQVNWRMGGQRIGYGFAQDHVSIFALFEREKLMTAAGAVEDPSKREYVQEVVVSYLPEAVLYVIPATTWENE